VKPDPQLRINGTIIGRDYPTYFIADIAANHDGDLGRAVELIQLAKAAGADAAKFQHFKAETIVSDVGFRALGPQKSHQACWNQSVFDVYRAASVDIGWTSALKIACDKAGIAFFTSPYALDIVDSVDPFVPAYKIGSGDITWIEIIRHIAAKQKPYILATGASTFDDVQRAVNTAIEINPRLALLQCNTNYTASLENFKYIHLNVLQTFQKIYPDIILGLSDHTPGHATVLGAVSLGARIIEKHFTDDIKRVGPDHKFSMDPRSWSEMVERTRELERSLGYGLKKIEENERDTVILQRRAIRLKDDCMAGTVLTRSHLDVLRPCPADGLPPYELPKVVGRKLLNSRRAGEQLRWTDLE
jgi:N-acetylneuraminate synthase